MMKPFSLLKFTITTCCLFIIMHNAAAQKKVYVFKMHGDIDARTALLSEYAFREAAEQKADAIMIDLETYGGLVHDGDTIQTRILNSKIPVGVFIGNNAASAGALIAIACDSIYMSPVATIGAASVVNETGELMPEKFQSYMRKKMRRAAELTGRNPEIAEGMVDENIVIDSLKEKGIIITFTTREALHHGYCNAQAETLAEAIRLFAGSESYEKIEHHSNWSERLALFFSSPAISGILLLLIFGGIYFEFKAPGTLFPIAVSLLAAMLYFVPLYIEGLAANWELMLFVLGLLLLLVEIFVFPGFGIAGVSGISLIIVSLVLALVRNVNFDFSLVPSRSFAFAFSLVAGAMIAPLILLLIFGKRIFRSNLFKQVSAVSSMSASEGYTVADQRLSSLIGKQGVAVTDLRPAGKIEVENNVLNVIAEADFISKGTAVRILRVSNNTPVVSAL